MTRISKKKLKELNKIKKMIIGSSVFLILILVFLIFRGFCLICYNVDDEKVILNDEVLEVKNNNRLGVIEVSDIRLTGFEDFIRDEELCNDIEECEWYFLDGDRNNPWFSVAYIDGFESFKDVFKLVDYEDLMEKYDISNDIELLDSYFEHQNDGLNIFTPVARMQISYLANTYFDSIHYSDDVYKISGDLDGYMYLGEMSYYILLTDGEDLYSMTFGNKDDNIYFNMENVRDILETVYFG